MTKILTAVLGVSAMLGASAAAATTINFTNPPGDTVGTSHTYTDGGSLSVTATGYSSDGGSTTRLYGKNAGGDEIGLGLTADPAGQDEIFKGGFIQLDVSNLIGNVTSAMFHFGSTTQGETWEVFGSNTAGVLGTGLLTGTNDEASHNLLGLAGWGTYQYYDFVSLGTKTTDGFTSGNVLLGNLALVPSVPEPATWAMMLLGFGAIGVSFRRRKPVSLAQIA